MEPYDYRKAMKEDILNYIKDNDVLDYEYDSVHELHEILNDELWPRDDITGNGPYGYDSGEHCEEYIKDNLQLVLEAMREFECELNNIPRENNKFFKYCDTVTRCYLLWEMIWEVLKELGFEEDYA